MVTKVGSHVTMRVTMHPIIGPTDYYRTRLTGYQTNGVALVASGVPNQVQAGTGDVHNPHTSVPRLTDRFCTPLPQQ